MRFTTAAQLVNEQIEAKNKSELNRVTNRWTRYDLIVIDEMAYVAMPEAAAEMMFQIIAGRAERAAVIVTTNLPFSEWTTMFRMRGCARRCLTAWSPVRSWSHSPMRGRLARALRCSLLEGIQDGHVEVREITLVPSGHGEAVNASCGGHHGVLA